MFASATLVSWIAAALVGPQDPVADAAAPLIADVAKRLASTTAADVAWGGHLAQRFRLAGAEQPLRDALRRWRDAEGDEARQVRLHLIDALWTIESTPPTAEYEFLLDDPLTRVPAFLIAARDVKGNRDVLARIAIREFRPHDLAAYAAGGLLVDLDVRQEDFVRHLLAVAKWRIVASVVDDPFDAPFDAVESTEEQHQHFDGAGETNKGFPPLVHHRLTNYSRPEIGLRGTTIVRLGDTRDEAASTPDLPKDPSRLTRGDVLLPDSTVLHRRQEGGAYKPYEPPGAPQVAPGRDAAVRWLRIIAAVDVPPATTPLELRWEGAAAFTAAIDAKRADLRARTQDLVPALVFRKWLTKDGPPPPEPVIEVQVIDGRGNKDTPLPKVDGSIR